MRRIKEVNAERLLRFSNLEAMTNGIRERMRLFEVDDEDLADRLKNLDEAVAKVRPAYRDYVPPLAEE